MRDDIYTFWKNNSLDNIKPPIGGEFPEGWDVIDFFRNLYTLEDYGETVEIGCGYGRICEAFDPDNYAGLDISPSAIEQAQFDHHHQDPENENHMGIYFFYCRNAVLS